jgi:hypothetical protein
VSEYSAILAATLSTAAKSPANPTFGCTSSGGLNVPFDKVPVQSPVVEKLEEVQAGLNSNEFLDLFSDFVGGSKRYILGIEDLERRPGETRVFVEVSAYPLTLEIRGSGRKIIRIQAGQCHAEIGKSGLILSGGADIRVSDDQRLHCSRIRCLGSFHGFLTEGPYVFETEGETIEGENGLFALEQERLRLAGKKYSVKNELASVSPLQFVNAFIARGITESKSSGSLRLFSNLFLGSFHHTATGPWWSLDESAVKVTE